jgi:hypothetical protein
MMMIIIINTKKKKEKEPTHTHTHTHIYFFVWTSKRKKNKKTRVYDNKTTVGKKKRWTTPSTIRTRRREKKTHTLQTKNNPRCEI